MHFILLIRYTKLNKNKTKLKKRKKKLLYPKYTVKERNKRSFDT